MTQAQACFTHVPVLHPVGVSAKALQWNFPERPPLVSDHLTKILIGSPLSVKLLLVKLPVSDHPSPDIKGGRLWVATLYFLR